MSKNNKYRILIISAILMLGIAYFGCTTNIKVVNDNNPLTNVIEYDGKEQEKIELNTLYFDFDSFEIKESEMVNLRKNINILNDVDIKHNIIIEGHCDERGTSKYNKILGQNRAETIKNYLVQHGINSMQLLIISYGEEKPIDNNSNEIAWSKNRRVEFKIIK